MFFHNENNEFEKLLIEKFLKKKIKIARTDYKEVILIGRF